MRLQIRHNIREVQSQLDEDGRQTRFALAVALNRTANDVKAAELAELQAKLDRPTTYALRSMYVVQATSRASEVGRFSIPKAGSRYVTRRIERRLLQAEVALKDEVDSNAIPAAWFIEPQTMGGQRNLKRFERSLQIMGLMPQGWHAVPGRRARLDANGNVSRGQIIQILSQLRVRLTDGYERKLSATDKRKQRKAYDKAGGQYFVVREQRGRLPPGIYQRRDFALGSALPESVFVFVERVQYRKLVDWDGVADRTTEARLEGHFEVAFASAMRTA